MITDLRNTDFVSFHIKPSITDETWNWIVNELNAASLLTADGFISCVDLGFVRTSDGSRYNKNLYPTIEDKTVLVPGGHGNYYFGMFWRDKDFSIPIAYDEMTETLMRATTLLFAGDRKMWDIYFDEEPYKVWHVKITSPVQLNYICMDEPNNGSVNPEIIHNHMLGGAPSNNNISNSNTRIYKGEGTISLKAYTPFARERFKYLSQYSESNKEEWAIASRLLADLISNNHVYDFHSAGSVTTYEQVEINETIFYNYTAHDDLEEFEDDVDYFILNDQGKYIMISDDERALGPEPGVIYYTRERNGVYYTLENGQYVEALVYDETKIYYRQNQITVTNGRYNLHNAGDVECDWELIFTPPANGTVTINNYPSLDGSGQRLDGMILENIVLKNGDTQLRIDSKKALIEGLNGSTSTGTVYNKYLAQGQFFKIPRGDSSIVITYSSGEPSISSFNYEFKYF